MIMNGLLILIISAAVLGLGYLLYGRYLVKTWGIDDKAKPPAYELKDGVDYVPAKPGVVFGHQFASIAGAGPINGPIQAAVFGWVPVLLWILLGGVFFGAVQDFVAMYASVRNKGKTIGYIIEMYIGHIGKSCLRCLPGCSRSSLSPHLQTLLRRPSTVLAMQNL